MAQFDRLLSARQSRGVLTATERVRFLAGLQTVIETASLLPYEEAASVSTDVLSQAIRDIPEWLLVYEENAE